MSEMKQAERSVPLEDVERRLWDVVVVGTGMGGATVGHALALQGHSVLFLEKGEQLHKVPEAKSTAPTFDGREDPESRLKRGHWPFPINGVTSHGAVEFFAPMGCGTGGSTTLYAAQLERFRPEDFAPGAFLPRDSGADVPEVWPITYDEMGSFYAEAERLFNVCGTEDPLCPTGAQLREPPPLSVRDSDLADFFVSRGLHPYRAHVACRYLDDCMDCGGRFCARACKVDAGWGCLLPALAHDAQLVARCDVTNLEAGATRVTAVHCQVEGRPTSFRGRIVILAAGAYTTPVLLLRSRNAKWPNGLANRTGLVGRNLMFHASDFYAIKPSKNLSATGPNKSIAINDFYVHEGSKLGTLHNVGIPVSYGYVLMYLRQRWARNQRWWSSLVRPALRPAALMGSFYFRHAGIFATDIEDLPYHENRVELAEAANGSRFYYRYPQELIDRVQLSRKAIVARLGRGRVVRLTAGDNLNYGHVCGTCRFGVSSRSSVLDHNNRAHDLENLYVVDASFFPTSGGINPSLTIAANALRVAKKIHDQIA